MATYKVNVNTRLRIRTEPNINADIIGYLHKGDVVVSDKEEGTWVHHSLGWSAVLDGGFVCLNTDGTETSTSALIKASATDSTNDVIDEMIDTATTMSSEEASGYMPNIDDYIKADNMTASKLLTSNLSGIYGMPYQFMSNCDRRLPGTMFGRKYAEKIISRMPLLLLTPGRVEFMRGFSTADKQNVATELAANALDKASASSSIDALLSTTGKYYTFAFDYAAYYDYVNPFLRTAAKMAGIGSTKVTIGNYTEQLQFFDWAQAKNADFTTYITAEETVPFYMDSETSISESFSNNTTESALSTKTAQWSDTAREISFLMGTQAGVQSEFLSQDNYDASLAQLNSLVADNVGNNAFSNLIKNISSEALTIATGGKLLFPEIWADSEFSKSYDITLKLRSPDKDTPSVFLNTIVPYGHIVCMTACRQMSTNGYMAPFLVRGSYKGLFNCDMGIISNLSVTKGKEGEWNADGLPTSMDLNITLKDLYSSLMISNQEDVVQFMKNTSLVDYIANMVGINIHKPEIERIPTLYYALEIGKIKEDINLQNFGGRTWRKMENEITNLLHKIF